MRRMVRSISCMLAGSRSIRCIQPKLSRSACSSSSRLYCRLIAWPAAMEPTRSPWDRDGTPRARPAMPARIDTAPTLLPLSSRWAMCRLTTWPISWASTLSNSFSVRMVSIRPV